MTQEPDLAAQVAAAASGRPEAWDQLVRRYAGLVYAIARSYDLSHSDIEDVSQVVWLTLVTHLPRLREPRALGAWLATTTRRECVAASRRKWREQPAEIDTALPDHASGPDLPGERAEEDSLRTAVLASFDELSGRCRKLLRLLTLDPPASYAEAAAALGVRIGTIGGMKADCVRALRRSPRVRDFIG